MNRVVFDTNVVVSSVLKREGAEAYVLDLAAAHQIQLYVTQEILEEYDEVLHRAKFKHLEPGMISGVLDLIRRASILVKPGKTLSLAPGLIFTELSGSKQKTRGGDAPGNLRQWRSPGGVPNHRPTCFPSGA